MGSNPSMRRGVMAGSGLGEIHPDPTCTVCVFNRSQQPKGAKIAQTCSSRKWTVAWDHSTLLHYALATEGRQQRTGPIKNWLVAGHDRKAGMTAIGQTACVRQ